MTDPNLKDKPKQAATHPGRRRTSTPNSGAAGHTRGNRAPGNNGGGPPRRLKTAPQRRKDTNNLSPVTQSHTQPPGAAAQPAEPGPNPAGRVPEPKVYIAHPTHWAGTRPNRTQPPTAARKTTLNAGQCVRRPREGRGRNRQAPPPKKNRGGGGGGAKTAHSHQTVCQHHKRRPNPPARRHRRQDPGRGTGGPPSQNRQHQARNSGPPGKGTPKHADTHHEKKKKKSQQPSSKEKGWGDRGHKARDRDTQQPTPQSQKKTKRAKNTPRQPSREGRGTAETRAQHARPHCTPEPETTGGKRSTHATTHVPKAGRNQSPTTNTTNSRQKRDNTTNRAQTHPTKTPARTGGVNETHTQPQPGPKHKRRTTVGNPVPTARALRQTVPCR